MKVLLVQPPFTQLNAPYPAIYYLRSFLEREEGIHPVCADQGIELFRSIYCQSGLRRIFADAEERLDDLLADAEGEAIRNLLRYRANADRYVASIDSLVAFLAGTNREYGHVIATGDIPWGYRVEQFIADRKFPLSPDETKIVATLVLDDIADFIRYTLDEDFALVKYGDTKAASQLSFGPLRSALESGYLLPAFYRPILDGFFAPYASGDERVVLALSVPFPGTVLPALYASGRAREVFGGRCTVVWGGGYVNTELRYVKDPVFFDFCDALVFDRGYAGLAAVLDRVAGAEAGDDPGPAGLYRTLVREGGAVTVHRMAANDYPVYRSFPESFSVDCAESPAGGTTGPAAGAVPSAPEDPASLEDRLVSTVFPDYSGVDFSRYLFIAESGNPMHRLWSDGRWLKAYLAYGCYHHRCAFCDVTLDYIAGYRPTATDALFSHLLGQRRVTGQSGVHFVDEALPPAHLKRFAELNLQAGRPLSFWGNVRFERAFNFDAARLLSSAGLLGVSAGIEVATDRTLGVIGKGMSLEDIVGVCLAFAENRVLVHAYLMYGYYTESPGEIIDSMEVVRQLFVAGLVRSAFWHRFVLTRHSRAFAEHAAGGAPGLLPRDEGWSFASNDLDFEGSKRFGKFDAGLDAALYSWMEGEGLDRPVREWFDFPVPHPSVKRDLVEGYAERARARLDASLSQARPQSSIWWLGGRPVAEAASGGTGRGAHGRSGISPRAQGGSTPEAKLIWFDRNVEQSILLPRAAASYLADILVANGPRATPGERENATRFVERLDALAGGDRPFHETAAFRRLRRNGLVFA